MDEFPSNLVVILVGAGAKTVIYAFLLWIMVKLQGLNYTLIGLLASSAVAMLVSFIPVAGPYLAYAALLVCLRKVTQADIFPDCVFTAVIANSLMFVANLFLIGALIGSIRPDLAESVSAREADYAEASAPTKSSFFSFGEDEDDTLLLRGVTLGTSVPSAVISRGSSYHTILLNETIAVRGGDGKSVYVKCEEISSEGVLLEINGEERVRLELAQNVGVDSINR